MRQHAEFTYGFLIAWCELFSGADEISLQGVFYSECQCEKVMHEVQSLLQGEIELNPTWLPLTIAIKSIMRLNRLLELQQEYQWCESRTVLKVQQEGTNLPAISAGRRWDKLWSVEPMHREQMQ